MSRDALTGKMKSALHELTSKRSHSLVAALDPILQENVARGRVQYYLDQNQTHTVEQYVLCQVVHYYDVENDYVNQIQVEKSEEAWLILLPKMRKWAYSVLGKWVLEQNIRTEYAVEIAQESVIQIVNSYYPYDVPFEAWACRLIQNRTYKYMKKVDRQPVDVTADDLSEIVEYIQTREQSDERPTEAFMLTQRDELIDAVQQLPAGQRQTIWGHYFLGLSFDEIAARTAVSKNAIYKRHFDGLANLRKILASRGDNNV